MGGTFLPDQTSAISLRPVRGNQASAGGESPFMKPARVSYSRGMNKGASICTFPGQGRAKSDREKQGEKWMFGCVTEIVKNLKEAPLMVHMYPPESGGEGSMVLQKSADEEDWAMRVKEWARKEVAIPEGVIFVERLEGSEPASEFWGVVVQAAGEECSPMCYLLKTSTSPPLVGSDVRCTHFSLTRVDFRESVVSQLKRCWLLEKASE